MYRESTQDTLVPSWPTWLLGDHKQSHDQMQSYTGYVYKVLLFCMFLFSFVGFFQSYSLTVRSYTYSMVCTHAICQSICHKYIRMYILTVQRVESTPVLLGRMPLCKQETQSIYVRWTRTGKIVAMCL